jgi:quinol monooxygenase YgiN
MIILKIRTKIAIEKKNEFEQAIQYIIGNKLKQKVGVIRHMYQDYDDPLSYFYIEEWESGEDINEYLSCDAYKSLIGAMNFLGQVMEAQLITTSEIENILH